MHPSVPQKKTHRAPFSAALAFALLGLLTALTPISAQQPMQSEVTVRPLFYAATRPPSGGMGRTRIQHQRREVADADLEDSALRLAISENLPRGAGEMLRASSWVAAVAAARVTGDPLLGHSFLLDVQGAVDGPSAGALFAVGMLAALRGDSLFPDATMTGALLPDGALGLIGGIRHKLDAAKQGGMRKVVLPESQRIDFEHSGAILDVADYARQIGVEVVFVGSLQEAYYELTGALLTRPAVAPRGDVTLPAELLNTIRERARNRFESITTALDKFRESPGLEVLQSRSNADRTAVFAIVDREHDVLTAAIERGLALMQEGEWVAAYDVLAGTLLQAHALIAWRNDNYTIASDTRLGQMLDRDLENVMARRHSQAEFASHQPVESALLEARANRDWYDMSIPLRLNDSIQMLLSARADEVAGRPKGFWDSLLGTAEERDLRDDTRYWQAHQTFMGYRYQAASAILESADPAATLPDPDFLASGLVFRDTRATPRPLNPRRAREWAVFSLSSFKAVHDALDGMIDAAGEDAAFAMLFDPLARRALALSESFGDTDPEADPEPEPEADKELSARDWFAMAVSLSQEEIEISAYLARIELGQFATDDGRNPRLRGGSLRRLLDRAAENARHAILGAQRTGYQVIGPRYDYLLAEGLRSGDTEDQFKALRLYWSAGALCQLVELCTQP